MATIQWYPGHMNKAKNQLEDKLNLIDVVIEVLDARLPVSSRNPMIGQITKQKPHIIILNKADLADPIQTKKWTHYFQDEGNFVLSMDAQHNTNMTALFKIIKLAGKAKVDNLVNKGASNPIIRVAIAGIPNCGKSTIINRMVGRNAAIVGDKPGVTKGQSWLKTSDSSIQILDTPGILWPKFSDQEVGYKLAACGAIKDNVFHADDVALFLINFLKEHYLSDLVKFSRLDKDQLESLSDVDAMLEMTKMYGMRDDYERFSLYMLQRFRKAKIGRITLDLR
ncbi:ribosome biogenesis GTPase YlqF [Lactobacillus sp. PV037]|uniref:ribosome biogenesis GTPase YlqF n=1 Tax=unclassified Lactobacillus TaxID=2620435 RepID=UPI00223F865E|nr:MULTISPECIES: ribosome biogenesis GTPase YlqF [unclassified Lactobacillus]QNQ82353.1 ribosome biogenesis GTPase YlqF [Lactobacillus sp. PV012]QNQ83534.1 ribosome biogenesis GTPase YlqF [Lactobacillus sp. PV037]